MKYFKIANLIFLIPLMFSVLVTISFSKAIFIAGLIFFVLLIFLYFKYVNSEDALLIVASINFCFLFYVLFAENIINLDKMLKLKIVRKMILDTELTLLAKKKLQEEGDTISSYKSDPLFYNRVPGSKISLTYESGMEPFVVEVDSTGYLNLEKDLYNQSDKIDIFFSGDSVIQGVGMPSVVEKLRRKTKKKLWNLSTGSYSPTQKTTAMKIFGIPKKPDWMVIDFYSGNDVSEINEDVICRQFSSYNCRFTSDLPYYLHQNSQFQDIVDFGFKERINFIIGKSLSLSLLRLIVTELTKFIPVNSTVTRIEDSQTKLVVKPAYNTREKVLAEKHTDWVKVGLNETLKSYLLLKKEIEQNKFDTKLILLYNPTSYELYREIWTGIDAHADEIAKLQKQTLLEFCKNNQIEFVDLTLKSRERLAKSKQWIFGPTDNIHWSEDGTEFMAEIIYLELKQRIKDL